MDNNDSYDYMRGQQDCIDGLTAKDNQSNWYNRGYSEQYAYEQEVTEATKNAR